MSMCQYVRQRWQKCDTADASARGALASGSARQCASTVAAATRSRLALNLCDAYATGANIPRRSDSVKLGGRRPRAGARREGVGEPRWFGRPRGSPFHFVSLFVSHTPVTHGSSGAGARARNAGTLRGYHRGRPGMERRTLGITAAELVPRCVDHSDTRALERTPPCPGHAHLTYERARPLRGRRAALSLYACKLLAPPTHTTENTLTVGLPTRATQTPCP